MMKSMLRFVRNGRGSRGLFASLLVFATAGAASGETPPVAGAGGSSAAGSAVAAGNTSTAAVVADSAGAPNDSVLGTVDVTGAAAVPLPKLAVMPVVTIDDADTTSQLVVRRDLELSGQFDVVADEVAPKAIYDHDTLVDAPAWRAKGVEVVVKVVANKIAGNPNKLEILGSAFLVAHGNTAAFQNRIETVPASLRLSAHRMADALIGALTGLPGSFASHMVYSGRVGKNRQIFAIDADGFNLHSMSPVNDTSLAPTFGPDGSVYYAISHDMGPFELVKGPESKKIPLGVPGSIFGIDFSPDGKKLAVAIASNAGSRIFVGDADGNSLSPISTAPLANHPVFGPGGRMAYVGGATTGQRVYVDNKPISPAGFSASAPTFCNTPNGVLVIFTVGVGKGADLLSTDIRGGSLTRLTQGQGANSYPACSPDGRLVAFFSTRKTDKGPGLYVAPVAMPGRAKRISNEVGESLRWTSIPATP